MTNFGMGEWNVERVDPPERSRKKNLGQLVEEKEIPIDANGNPEHLDIGNVRLENSFGVKFEIVEYRDGRVTLGYTERREEKTINCTYELSKSLGVVE